MKQAYAPAAIALVALLWTGQAASAATTAEDASALETQLHDYLADLAGPLFPADARPIQVTPDGDGFLLRSVAPASASNVLQAGSAVTLKATRLDDGRWQLDDLLLPNPLLIKTPVPAAPPTPGKPAAPTEVRPATAPMTISSDKRSSHGVFDPSYTTESSFSFTSDNNHTIGPNSETTSAHSEQHARLTPSGDGLVDVTATGTSDDGQQIITSNGARQPMILRWAHSQSEATLKALSPVTLGDLIRHTTRLAALQTADGKPKPSKHVMTPAEQALAGQIVQGFFGFAGAARMEATLEKASLTILPVSATMDALQFAWTQDVVDGHAHLGLRVAFKGLASPAVPPGIFQDYAPRTIILAPHVTALAPDDLKSMALTLVSTAGSQADTTPPSLDDVLAKGPIEFGMDELLIDLGPATLKGTGTLHLTARNVYDATAELSMTGLDAMIERLKREPSLAQVLVPLTILRGVGKQEGTSTSWSVAVRNGHATVNGIDLSSLMPR